MARKERQTKKNNIVIVCEGEDTEPAYLEDLKRAIKNSDGPYDEIRIVPFGNEAKMASARDALLKKHSRKLRTMNSPLVRLSGKFYWVKEEVDVDTYERYKGQPTRYVREAQLFLEDGYVEAWAVYDQDKFPDHEQARALAESDPNLNIAFTSVSFEEWLLLHFERNEKPFPQSCCKKNKKDIGCGDHKSGDENDCHGTLCIAGYLRENNLIPDFAKSNTNLFSKYTLKRLNLARVNASWVRTLSPDKVVYQQNPYTDFDQLLSKLMGLEDRYIWIGNAETYIIDRCQIGISRNFKDKEITLINNSDLTFISNYVDLDAMANQVGKMQRLQLLPGDKIPIKLNHPYLMVGDERNKHVITFD